MKRQNSSTSASPHSNHNRGGERSDNELIMTTPPASSSLAYNNRLGSPYGGGGNNSSVNGGGGRRRKLIHSTDHHHHRDANTAIAASSSTTVATGGSLANSLSNNATPRNDNFEINSFLNLLHTNNHQQQQHEEEESDDEVSKKRKKPSATLFTTPTPLFTTTILHTISNACDTITTACTTAIATCTNTKAKLQTKLQTYRKKLSNLSPRQKLYMCGVILLWKFVQAWLILRVFVWLGTGGGGGSAGGGGNVGGGTNVVAVGGANNGGGRSMEQRMELDQQLKREIRLSLVEEGRLNDGNNDKNGNEEEEESRLWLDMMGGNNDGVQQQNEEVMVVGTTTTTRILYMITVTCNLQSYNIKRNTTTNLDDILSTLSSNIQTMIVYPEYTVDVYWIMGCSSSSLGSTYYTTNNNNVSGRKEEVEKESSSEYWKSYISRHLPSGVGLEIWEDAMPLDYSLLSSQNQQQQSQQQKRRRLEEGDVVNTSLKATTSPLHSKAQFNKSTMKKKQGVNNIDINDGNIILYPSIEKFMKQHRYVVRDKLEYYDVFLSFGASLKHHDPQSSNSNRSVNNSNNKRQQQHEKEEVGESITLNNGTTIPYCKQKLYQETTDIHCNERVEYMMKRYHMSDVEAKISLLEKKECICSSSGSDTNVGNGGDASSQAISSSSSLSRPSSLERITGDHVDAYLTLSSELDKLRTQGLIIPGFMVVDVVPTAAAAVTTAKDDSGLQQFDIDALPCCNDSVELTIETRKTGATIDTDNDWQFVKTVGDSDEVVATDNKDEGSSEWIALEVKSADNAIPAFSFYEDGWILTKEQLLRLDYGNNRGKFLPPFLDDYSDNNNAVDKKKKVGLASPLFEAREKGGFGVRRAISLEKSTFSKQLVLRRSRASTSKRPNASSVSAIGVRELLHQFHNAKEKKEQ